MRHLKHGRKLGRNATHRVALMRNLARALIHHGRITTTVEKAKALRPFVEKLVTLTKKKNALHARRLALARLPDKETISTLFSDLGPRFADRPGGYTRIIKLHQRRLGDGGKTAIIEFLRAGETKVKQRAARPAPLTSKPSLGAPSSTEATPTQEPTAPVAGSSATGPVETPPEAPKS
jgi:large subunit ribosomal protein L17